ncbi:MAG: hypothetical protein EA398_11440 [Deltaproteobacteria bacterium]|nr:MAG: hypothetical protein EA398_11440 [Deltaproteobacteria bacterium]
MLGLLAAALLLPGCPSATHRPGASEERARVGAEAPAALPAVLYPAEEPPVPADDPGEGLPDELEAPEIPCALPVSTWQAERMRVNHALPPSDAAFLRTRILEESPAPGVVAVHWELRDEDGLQRGEEWWRCVGEELHLDRVVEEEVTVRFVPPLPVVGTSAGAGEQDGMVLVIGLDGHRSAPYSFTWVREEAETPERLADLDATWWSTATRLAWEAEVGVLWETRARWGVGSALFLAAERTQRITRGEETGQRREEAALVFR